MRALRWHGRRDVRLDDVEDAPDPRPGEVRIEIDWCGVCGTDLEEFIDGPVIIRPDPHPLTGVAPPVIIGHEVAGRVLDSGRGVNLEPGSPVALDGMLHCGRCWTCQRHLVNLCTSWAHIGMSYPGGLAERLTVPAYMAVPAGKDVPADALALAEPFAVAVRAVRKTRIRVGETMVILGAGTIGLAVLQVARATGAGAVSVVDPSAFRRAKAVELGATAALAPSDTLGEHLADQTGRLVDVVVDCTGSSRTPRQAVALVRPAGRVVLVGLPPRPGEIDYLALIEKEVELTGSLGHVYDEDFRTSVELISSRRVDATSLITHRLPLEDVVERGFMALANPGDDEVLKVLGTPLERAAVPR